MPAGAKRGRWVTDAEDAYTPQQLARIGAIALIWNQIKAMIDFQLMVIMRLDPHLWTPVTTQLRGIDGKIQLLRIRANTSKILSEEAKQSIKLCLDGIVEYKKYRDDIVHSHIFDVDKGIAIRVGYNTQICQVLVTQEALDGFYERLKILKDEFREVDLLFRLSDEQDAVAVRSDLSRDQAIQQRKLDDVPKQMPRVLEFQQKRSALRALPEFPAEESEQADVSL